jgi:hypothetical protein
MPAQQGVWLDDEQGLVPGSNQPGQEALSGLVQ